MIEAVLIDFDGTLMDTDEVVLRSWEHTYRQLGREVPPAAEIRRTFGEPLRHSMEYVFPDVPVDESLAIYRAYNLARFLDYAKPYPGMVELIDRLREKGILTALVTSRLKNTTYLGLEHFDLVRRFDAIFTEDDIELLTSPADFVEYKGAITEALQKGAMRHIKSEENPKNVTVG